MFCLQIIMYVHVIKRFTWISSIIIRFIIKSAFVPSKHTILMNNVPVNIILQVY